MPVSVLPENSTLYFNWFVVDISVTDQSFILPPKPCVLDVIFPVLAITSDWPLIEK